MTFKKLALATAIASMPAAALAVETLDDAALGDVTGQDGIEVALNIGTSGISTNIYIHDKDGLTGLAGAGSYTFDGAIVIENMVIMNGGGTITLSIDAGDSGVSATAPILNVNVALPTTMTISTGAIRVANSGRDDAPADFGITGATATILNNMDIILGSTTLNIQLGNEQQTGSLTGTDMIVLNGTVNGGISISGMRLSDANSGGGIGATTMTIDDNGVGTNLTLNLDINATNAGLEIGLGQVGSATGMDINIVDQYLGSTSAGIMGDVSVVGLNLNGSNITISGK